MGFMCNRQYGGGGKKFNKIIKRQRNIYSKVRGREQNNSDKIQQELQRTYNKSRKSQVFGKKGRGWAR